MVDTALLESTDVVDGGMQGVVLFIPADAATLTLSLRASAATIVLAGTIYDGATSIATCNDGSRNCDFGTVDLTGHNGRILNVVVTNEHPSSVSIGDLRIDISVPSRGLSQSMMEQITWPDCGGMSPVLWPLGVDNGNLSYGWTDTLGIDIDLNVLGPDNVLFMDSIAQGPRTDQWPNGQVGWYALATASCYGGSYSYTVTVSP